MANYGYIRVSSMDQNEDRQTLAMNELDILALLPFSLKQEYWNGEGTARRSLPATRYYFDLEW